jgi:hypothetical protein
VIYFFFDGLPLSPQSNSSSHAGVFSFDFDILEGTASLWELNPVFAKVCSRVDVGGEHFGT